MPCPLPSHPVLPVTASVAAPHPIPLSAMGPGLTHRGYGQQGRRHGRRLAVRRLLAVLAAAALLALVADPAMAQATGGGADITTFLQNLVNIITGTAGRLLAVLAICVVGVGALLGALSMRTVGGVLLGVMLIFSSAWLIDQIIGA